MAAPSVPEGPHARRPAPRPLTNGAPQDDYGRGRTCASPDCATRLSRYNPSDVCARHAGWTDLQRPHWRRGHPGRQA
jgi:hypothetical protein